MANDVSVTDPQHRGGLIAQTNAGGSDRSTVNIWADPTTHRLLVDAAITIDNLTVSENIAQWGGVATSLGQKVMASSIPVTIASDQGAITVTATNPSVGTDGSAIPTSSTLIGASDGTNLRQLLTEDSSNFNLRATLYSGATKLIGQKVMTGSVPVVLASDQAAIPVTQSGSWSLSANQSVNVAQINGVTPLMGSGIMGTGSPRVTIASDNDPLIVKQATAANLNATVVGTGTFVVQATLAAETTKVIGTVNQGTSPWVVSNGGTFAVQATIAAGATSIAKAEDVASADADVGVPALAVRKATPANTSGTDGDYEFLQMSAGRLWVSAVIDTALPAGTALIGKVGIDQTTPGTTNLVALTAETTKVIGVTRTADGAGNLLTTNSTTYTAKFGLDTNLLGTLGTAFSTAGKVDVKSADGDVFVRSNAASTFPTQATLQTQTDTVMVGGVNIKEINAVTPLMGNGATGTGAMRITISNDNTGIANWGQGATGAAVPTGAQYTGAIAKTSLPAAATDGNLTGVMLDKFGRQVVLGGTIRDLRGSQTTTITSSTSETTVVTAGGAGIFMDLVALIFTNTSATVTRVDIRDATAGSIIGQLEIPATDTRGFAIAGESLPQTTANSNWTVTCGTSVSDLRIWAIYDKNK